MNTDVIIYDTTETSDEYKNGLIPVDFNIIELPLFSKNNKAKINEGSRYIISSKKNIQVEIIPVVGMSIPIDFDKKVYFALVQLAQEFSTKYNKSDIPEVIYTTFYEIFLKLGIQWRGGKITLDSMFPVGSTKERIYQSLSKLSGTKYKLYNCFYNANLSKKDENLYESTFIHSIKIIKMTAAIDDQHDSLNFIKSNAQEIIELKLNSFFLTNIINKKGHLKHSLSDFNKLNDSIARDIYFWCEKNRKWLGVKEYGHDKQIQVKVKKLAACLPLAFKGSNVPKTVYRVREAFDYLLEINLISSFIEHRSENGVPLSETWYEVSFNWSRDDKDYILTGREDYEIEDIKHLPLKAKNIPIEFDKLEDELKTIVEPYIKKISSGTLDKIHLKYQEKKKLGIGIEFIKSTLKYAGTKAKKNFDKYLYDSLEHEWAQVYVNDLIEESNKEQIKKEQAKRNSIIKEKELVDRVNRRSEVLRLFGDLSSEEHLSILAEFLGTITKKKKEKLTEVLQNQKEYLIAYWAQKSGLQYDGFKQLQLVTWKILS